MHGASEILPWNHEEGDAVLKELAGLSRQGFEEAFFDRLSGIGVGFCLTEGGEEGGDGVVVERVEEACAGHGLVHGIGSPEIELYGIGFV